MNKWLRLHIYKYLDIKETMRAASTSKTERGSAEKSEIAKEGKNMIIRIENGLRDSCLLCKSNGISDFVKKFGAAFNFTDTLDLHIGKLCIKDDQLCKVPGHPSL